MKMPRDARPSLIRSYLTQPRVKIVALFLSIVVCSGAEAEIYKWTDKEGGLHYSEQPPTGVKYEKVNPRYAPPLTTPAAQSKDEPQTEQQKAMLEMQQKEKQFKQEADRIRMQNCETVQKNLADLESAPRINLKNPDGTVQRLTEEERQAKIAEMQEMIKKYCD